jgi:hypothetical protein
MGIAKKTEIKEAEIRKIRDGLNDLLALTESVIEQLETEKHSHEKPSPFRWAEPDNLSTVGAKVSEPVAIHFATEAKRRRIPMSYVIVTALIETYGLPEGAILDDDA